MNKIAFPVEPLALGNDASAESGVGLLAYAEVMMPAGSEDVDTVYSSGANEPTSVPVKSKIRVKGVNLFPHEQALVESGQLVDITHNGASSIWLSAESAQLNDETFTLVYRPMGDSECAHLLSHGVLPDTQPYQTIVEGEEGRAYAEKYLRGHKSVDSSPTTVVEFSVPRMLVERLFTMQSKNEDGCISHGLGDKGGRGLPLFNASLHSGESSFRIVLVKRFNPKPTIAKCYNPKSMKPSKSRKR